MKKYLVVIIGVLALVTIVFSSAFAANTATFDVIVSVAASADITVTQGGSINFGVMGLNSSAVTGESINIKNTGSGSNQTYSLKLLNPAGWTAVNTVPGFDQYRLSSAFDNAGTEITWSVNNALTTTSVAASATQFAGNQTGLSVPYNGERKIWLKIETPSGTSSPNQKTIQVVLTATVD